MSPYRALLDDRDGHHHGRQRAHVRAPRNVVWWDTGTGTDTGTGRVQGPGGELTEGKGQ